MFSGRAGVRVLFSALTGRNTVLATLVTRLIVVGSFYSLCAVVHWLTLTVTATAFFKGYAGVWRRLVSVRTELLTGGTVLGHGGFGTFIHCTEGHRTSFVSMACDISYAVEVYAACAGFIDRFITGCISGNKFGDGRRHGGTGIVVTGAILTGHPGEDGR